MTKSCIFYLVLTLPFISLAAVSQAKAASPGDAIGCQLATPGPVVLDRVRAPRRRATPPVQAPAETPDAAAPAMLYAFHSCMDRSPERPLARRS